MSHIGKNIRKIRTVKKLSQADFAALFNLARPSVGAYEEGRSEPKIDTIIQMANQFGISIDRLLTRDITINELYHLDKFEKDVMDGQKEKKETGIPFVKAETMAQYFSQCKNPDFIRQLPLIALPDEGNSRAFEVSTVEMLQKRAGLRPGDIVNARAANIHKLEKDQIYIIITSSQQYMRRFKNQEDKLFFFEADNQDYLNVSLSRDEIEEVWEVLAMYTRHIESGRSFEARLSQLEKKVEKLLSTGP